MMFDDFCIGKILKGEKTVTRRLLRKDGKRPATPGKIHKLKKDRTQKTYGMIRILSCDIERIDEINNDEAKKEGFKTTNQFLDYFMDINDIWILSKFDYLWRIEFELIY